jgi:hypothetical protein
MWISGKLALSDRGEGVIKFLIFRSMGSTGIFYHKFGIFYFIPVAGWGRGRRDTVWKLTDIGFLLGFSGY